MRTNRVQNENKLSIKPSINEYKSPNMKDMTKLLGKIMLRSWKYFLKKKMKQLKISYKSDPLQKI